MATAVHDLIDKQRVSTIVLADIGKLVAGRVASRMGRLILECGGNNGLVAGGLAGGLLTLFALFGPETEPAPWTDSENGWQISTPDGDCRVSTDDDKLTVSTADKTWKVTL